MANRATKSSPKEKNTQRTGSKAAGSTTRKKGAGKNPDPARKKKQAEKAASAPKADSARDSGIPMANEIEMISSIGIMLIMMLSNFGLCGYMGMALSSFFFGVFGCVQYVMPVAFCLGVFILIANDYSLLSIKKCAAGFVMLMMISAFAQIIYQGGPVKSSELFSLAVEDHHAGGIIGGGFGLLLKNGFGTAGALVVVFCCLLLSLIMLTQRSFVGFFQNNVDRGGRFIDKIRENREITKEQRLERKARHLEEMGYEEEPEGPMARVSSLFRKGSGQEEAEVKQTPDRAKQVEEKLRKIEESRSRKEKGRSARTAKERLTREPEIHRNVPVFTSDEGVGRKDEVKELHPKVYPFTAEDGKTKDFDGTLDFTAFSFSSGKSPEEFAKEISRDSRELRLFLNSLEEYVPAYRAGGSENLSELTVSGEELTEKETDIDIDTDTDVDVDVDVDDVDIDIAVDAEFVNADEPASGDEEEKDLFHIVDGPSEEALDGALEAEIPSAERTREAEENSGRGLRDEGLRLENAERDTETAMTDSGDISGREAASADSRSTGQRAAAADSRSTGQRAAVVDSRISGQRAAASDSRISGQGAATADSGSTGQGATVVDSRISGQRAAVVDSGSIRRESAAASGRTLDQRPVVPTVEDPGQDIRINRAGTPQKAPQRKPAEEKDYIFPPMSLLTVEEQKFSDSYDQELKDTALKLQTTLNSFGVRVTITDISCGPAVTRYEMFPEQGTKVSKIVSLTDDIKLNLAAADIRIEAPIPGKAAVGIEVPNKTTMKVHLRELIDNRLFRNFKSKLAFAVGKDIGGKIVVADLAKMPHLLIAGATGSGKSVCINTLIMSLLYKASPDEVKLIMIDPKMVELSVYNGIPHLLIPVVTDPKKASGALNWAVAEMTDRYKKFAETNVRNLEGYNKKVDSLIASGEVEEGKLSRMPQIVIIIDELADLMMVAPGEVEDAIVRLSQLARAAGIHLVIATQRPSVNVITGLIKANVPSRIAFSVSSGVDSRTIIDMNGAEKLLGKGDMLFYPSGYQKPVRVQGALVEDSEVSDVVEFIKSNEKMESYDNEVKESIEKTIKLGGTSSEKDEYFEAAARFILEKDKATIGMLQRMFKIGFNRAARIMDQLADAGVVGAEEGTKPRQILMTPEQLEQYLEEYI